MWHTSTLLAARTRRKESRDAKREQARVRERADVTVAEPDHGDGKEKKGKIGKIRP